MAAWKSCGTVRVSPRPGWIRDRRSLRNVIIIRAYVSILVFRQLLAPRTNSDDLGNNKISQHLSAPARPGMLTGQVKFNAEKCKCATEGNSAAHWAVRSALRAVVARWSAGCDSVRCVQLACRRHCPIRFRITNISPTPSSMRPNVPGSGVDTANVPPAKSPVATAPPKSMI